MDDRKKHPADGEDDDLVSPLSGPGGEGPLDMRDEDEDDLDDTSVPADDEEADYL